MTGWVAASKGRLVYAGRVTRAPFQRWIDTSPGRSALDAAAAGIRFAPFGRTRAARRRLWRSLVAATHEPDVIAAVQAEADAYLRRAGDLAYADGLPRGGVELHRLVVVPRVLLNGAAYRSLDERLASHPAFADVPGGTELRQFFLLRLIYELHAAVVRSAPSPKRAFAAGDEWISVGVNSTFAWRVPINGPSWNGHHYVLELTRDPITRRVRKAIAERIQAFERSLAALTAEERIEILRRATPVA